MYKTTAEVKVKDNAGNVIKAQSYEKIVFEGLTEEKGKPVGGTPEELLSAAIQFYQSEAGEKGNGVVDLLSDCTYAYDLRRRQTVRNMVVAGIDGPDKAIEKSAKDIMAAFSAAGLTISIEDARAKVREMLSAAKAA